MDKKKEKKKWCVYVFVYVMADIKRCVTDQYQVCIETICLFTKSNLCIFVYK